MNRIDKLIAELCPDGVEFKEIWEVTAWDKKFNGLERYMQKTIIKYPYVLANKFKELESQEGNVRLLSTGDYIGWTTEELAGTMMCNGEIVAIPWGGKANVKYYKGKFVTADNRIATSLDTNILNNKYLYYWMLVNTEVIDGFYRGAGIKHPSMKSILTMKIPIPPLPIQQEIVRILDNFTYLDAELQAELEARKKQFNFYKEQLFNYNKNSVEWKSLGDVGKFQRGKRFVKNDIVSSGVPCIHYGELYTYYKTWTKATKSYLDADKAVKLRFAKPEDVIIVTAGETIEDIGNSVAWLGDTDVVIHDACFAYSHNFNPKFVSYFFKTDLFRSQIRRYISSGKISAIHASGLSKAVIPIPSLSEQERIVSILDKFEALVNEELPAEIAARRKQYEYYREKLLTFERAK